MIIQITVKCTGNLKENSQVLIFGLFLSNILHLLTAEAQLVGVRVLESSSVWEKGEEDAGTVSDSL